MLDFFGRRPLFLGAAVVTGCSDAVIGGFFLAERYGYDVSSLGWIPMVVVFVYIVCYTIGLCAVFCVFVGVIFPKGVRAKAVGVSIVVVAFIATVVTKLFQIVWDQLGKDCTFFMFSASTLGILVYVSKRMPETKGLKLEDVQKIINR